MTTSDSTKAAAQPEHSIIQDLQ